MVATLEPKFMNIEFRALNAVVSFTLTQNLVQY